MIQVAKDPKKGPAFLMKELQETNLLGAAIYKAPFSFGNFKSTLQKISTDRAKQTTTWRWEGIFFEAPKDAGEEVVKSINVKSDSLLNLLKYKRGSGPNSVGNLMTFVNSISEPVCVMVMLNFSKGIYIAEIIDDKTSYRVKIIKE